MWKSVPEQGISKYLKSSSANLSAGINQCRAINFSSVGFGTVPSALVIDLPILKV
jgi:hypothetical protein